MRTSRSPAFEGSRRVILPWILAAVATLAATELALRAAGRGPLGLDPVDRNEPTMHGPDPVLGWRARAGRYRVPPYSPGADPVEITILPDGSRRTAEEPVQSQRELLLLGGSIAQGWAVSDRESFAWRLQRSLPELRVVNFGTGGYGTFQSLLVMEQRLTGNPAPELVLYVMIDDHQRRNVGDARWLELLWSYARRGAVAVPYATLSSDGTVIRRPPQRFPAWPFAEHSALLAAGSRLHARLIVGEGESYARKVTSELIRSMQALAKRVGARFVAVDLVLTAPGREETAPWLADIGAETVECKVLLHAGMIVVGEGHPNGAAHEEMARCILDHLDAPFTKNESQEP